MLPSLESTLCKVIVSMAWSCDDDEFDVWVIEDVVERSMYLWDEAETLGEIC